MERRSSDKQDLVSSHTLTDYPKELQKKVTLLQHFKSYLEGDAKDLQAVKLFLCRNKINSFQNSLKKMPVRSLPMFT